MANTTPALQKQTVWFQLLTFASLLVDLIAGNGLISGYLGGAEGSILVMAGNLISIGLSLTRPITPKANLEILDETSDSVDSY